MRQRCHVFDRPDGQSRLLESGDGAFTPGSGALDFDVDFLHAEFHRLFSTLLGGHLARERSAFTTTLETGRTGRRPTQGIALGVGDRHGRIVEGRLDMSDPVGHVPLDFSFLCRCFCHCLVEKIVTCLNNMLEIS